PRGTLPTHRQVTSKRRRDARDSSASAFDTPQILERVAPRERWHALRFAMRRTPRRADRCPAHKEDLMTRFRSIAIRSCVAASPLLIAACSGAGPADEAAPADA